MLIEKYAEKFAQYLGIVSREIRTDWIPGEKIELITVKKFIPAWVGGQALGRKILIVDGLTEYQRQEMIDHELVHTRDWIKYKDFFLVLYGLGWLEAGFKYGFPNAYKMNKWEQKAYNRS